MRIKAICDYVSRGGAPDYVEDSEFKVMNQATFSKGFLDETNIRYTSHKIPSARIKKGDLLIASTGGGVLGKEYFFDADKSEFYADSHVTILRNSRGKNNMKYLFYYFYPRFEEINATMVKGSTNQTELQKVSLLNCEIDIPNFDHQNKIVAVLDSKVVEIDNIISTIKLKKERYIALKKSLIQEAVTKGIDHSPLEKKKEGWMGEMPCHWLVRRLKDVSVLYSGLTGKSGEDFRSDDFEGMKPFIPFTNILNNISVDFSQFKYVVMDTNEQQNVVREGDLLFLMSSEDYESIGKPSVVIGNPGEVYLNSFCRGLHFKESDIDSRFVNYQLSSELFRNALRFEARGFTRINIKIDKIYSMSICLPPSAEQKQIADYLDERCAKIDFAIEIIDKQIAKYTELKKSLINEVITGKRVI